MINHLTATLTIALLISILTNLCAKETTLTIYSAAGARGICEEICIHFQNNHKLKVNRIYGGSGVLARQIEAGASADLFISADKKWVDHLQNKGYFVKGDVRVLGGNSLVIVAPVESPLSKINLRASTNRIVVKERIAIGDPATVPVGNYTIEAFKKMGWYEGLKSKIIYSKDVSTVLRYVELGECDWGVVYKSEAILSKKVKILAEIPSEYHTPVLFYIAKLKESSSESGKLYTYFFNLIGEEALIKMGFQLVKP